VDFTAVAGGGEEIEFGYCTEFFIKNLFPETQQRDIDTFRNNLAKIGDCVLVVGDIGLVKTHVHTNEPGLALQYAQALGELSKIKVDNMREQHRHIHEEAEEPAARDKKELAVIAVTSGEGLRSIFADWQVDGFVEGGQSMNPSTDDILKAIEAMHAKNIMILPNNQNIILAAEQAADLCEENVVVIKTKSEPQGIAAAVAYDPERLIDENTERMNKAICTVRTGQITNAVRDTKMNGSKIKEGEVIGIADGKIVANGAAIENIAVELIEALTDEDSEIVTFYYGGQVEEPAAEKLFSHVRERFGNFDFELVYGGQPVYQYLISVE
jgi:DAK2 domain fusion protein YloV